MGKSAESLLAVELDLATRRKVLTDLWLALEANETSGATTWDVIEDLRIQVTDCLSEGSASSIRAAERLTAKAICLIGW